MPTFTPSLTMADTGVTLTGSMANPLTAACSYTELYQQTIVATGATTIDLNTYLGDPKFVFVRCVAGSASDATVELSDDGATWVQTRLKAGSGWLMIVNPDGSNQDIAWVKVTPVAGSTSLEIIAGA